MSDPVSHLLNLPAELRNEIIWMVLPQEEVIEIPRRFRKGSRNGWPSIVDVCKQLREEALPVFFANNTFQVSFADEGTPWDEGLTPWLEKFKTLPFATKRLVKSVKIDFGIELMDWKEGICEEADEYCTELQFSPHFDACDTFTRHISEAGLMAHQLDWPRPVGKWLSGDLDDYGTKCFYQTQGWADWKGGHLFNAYVLSPLLERYGLFDERNPPVDVSEEFDKDSAALRVYCEGCAFEYGGVEWKGHEPENWYWACIAEKEGLPEGEELFCDWDGSERQEEAYGYGDGEDGFWEDEYQEGELFGKEYWEEEWEREYWEDEHWQGEYGDGDYQENVSRAERFEGEAFKEDDGRGTGLARSRTP